MTPQLTVNLLRVLFVTFCTAVGSIISNEAQGNALPGMLAGVVFGLFLVLADRLLKGFSLRAFSSATLGLLLGLFFANLLLASQVLRYQSETMQWAAVWLFIAPLATSARCSRCGAIATSSRSSSLTCDSHARRRNTNRSSIDTNVIIDGRIADLCATGFLSRSLIVPRFVLDELQTLADSRDGIKRERGRRGLEILNQLQRSREIELTIHDSGQEGDGDLQVDARLVRVAKLLQARLLTNDQALCQVARLQQVPVLNLNDLSRALRPVVVAGDELELNLVKEGRDPHQAVGYLPDGTMIVVNHARPHVGTSRDRRGLERAPNRRRPADLCRAKRKRAVRPAPSAARELKPPNADRPRFALVSSLRWRSYWRAPRPAPGRHRCNPAAPESPLAVFASAQRTPTVCRKAAS